MWCAYKACVCVIDGMLFPLRYDRSKLQLKEIHNVQYVSCMNPTAGSFTINPRLQVLTISVNSILDIKHSFSPDTVYCHYILYLENVSYS